MVHPAAKVLVELSALQDREVGDGTTSVVIIGAELLRQANELIDRTMHPTTVMSGYQLALRKALNFIEQRLQVRSDALSDEQLLQVAKTSMSSKILGLASDHYARIVVDAVRAVRTVTDSGEVRHPVKAIGVVQALGGALQDAQLVRGYALAGQRASM